MKVQWIHPQSQLNQTNSGVQISLAVDAVIMNTNDVFIEWEYSANHS